MNDLFEDIVAPYTPLMTVLHSATPSDSTIKNAPRTNGTETSTNFNNQRTKEKTMSTLTITSLRDDLLKVYLDGDLITLKKQINALISMIEVNTNALHANTIATDNLTIATMANTNARTVANSANFVEELRSGSLEPKHAKEINNTAGKVIASAKVQLEYANLRGETPTIEFLS